jgi:hypothetical protein
MTNIDELSNLSEDGTYDILNDDFITEEITKYKEPTKKEDHDEED